MDGILVTREVDGAVLGRQVFIREEVEEAALARSLLAKPPTLSRVAQCCRAALVDAAARS
jgi:hypothetical protein